MRTTGTDRTPRRFGRAGSERAPHPSDQARSICPSCGAARYSCRGSDGDVVVLDAVPRPGGRFLVNPYTCTIVAVQSVSRARVYGFVVHRTVCAARVRTA